MSIGRANPIWTDHTNAAEARAQRESARLL